MSRTRQPRIPARPDGSVWVRTYPVRFTADYASAVHDHAWHQLSYASVGVLRVATADNAWIVPPQRAVWIPAGVKHSEEMRGAGAMRSLYVAAAVARGLPAACAGEFGPKFGIA